MIKHLNDTDLTKALELTDNDIIKACHEAGFNLAQLNIMTYETGAYDITVPTVALKKFIEIITAQTIRDLVAEVERLKQGHHDIYEIYAGSEGFIPETAGEGYQQELIKQMANIAARNKGIWP